jgi:hypothetical protein
MIFMFGGSSVDRLEQSLQRAAPSADMIDPFMEIDSRYDDVAMVEHDALFSRHMLQERSDTQEGIDNGGIEVAPPPADEDLERLFVRHRTTIATS